MTVSEAYIPGDVCLGKQKALVIYRYIRLTRKSNPCIHMAFSEELKNLRLRLKLTQSEMALQLHVDPSRISRWEHDEVPTLDNVMRISKTYNVDALKWLDDDPTQLPDEVPPAEGPRLVHMSGTRTDPNEDRSEWRSKAVDLMARMADLLDYMLRKPRGGGGVANYLNYRE